jgi:mannose-6-phosphate isomerase
MELSAALHAPARMDNPVKTYDWGSTTALALLQGREMPGHPEAELWMGAHRDGPSQIQDATGARISLPAAIEADPENVLGTDVLSAFGPRLPYLLKILAIDKPLSIQVHPDAERAASAYHQRSAIDGHIYSDPYPKPEMLYALQPVEALCGFRDPADARHLLGLLHGHRIATIAACFAAASSAEDQLRNAFTAMVTWPDEDRAGLVREFSQGAARLLRSADDSLPTGALRALHWVGALADLHPGDPMIGAPLLFELVAMEPGETLFVPAGAPHAYLGGVGVEIMGNSDNVLRAGLTHKPISIGELLHTLDAKSTPVVDIDEEQLSATEVAWRPQAREFQLTRVRLSGGQTPLAPLVGPQIVLCTTGAVTIATEEGAVALTPGHSAFLSARCGPAMASGTGELFRAAVA